MDDRFAALAEWHDFFAAVAGFMDCAFTLLMGQAYR